MAFIPAPNCALAIVAWDLNGADGAIALNFNASAPFDATALTNLGTALLTWQVNSLLPLQSNEILNRDIRLYALDSETAPAVTVAPVTPTNGTRGGQSMPNNVAAVVTHYSTTRGRSGRGRSYIPGISESDVAGNILVPAIVTGLGTAFDVDLPAALPAGVGFVILSKYENKLPRPAGVPRAVNRSTVRTATVGTQRRRLGVR